MTKLETEAPEKIDDNLFSDESEDNQEELI